jgi:hypothetical protein
MSTAVVFFDIEKVFDTAWPSSLQYKLTVFISAIKLNSSILTVGKFKVLIGNEFSTPKKMAAIVSQGSFPCHTIVQAIYK